MERFTWSALTGRSSTLENVRYNGQARITGLSGQAEIDVDSANVSSIVSEGGHDDWAARVSTIDGRELELRVDGSLVISGDAPESAACEWPCGICRG